MASVFPLFCRHQGGSNTNFFKAAGDFVENMPRRVRAPFIGAPLKDGRTIDSSNNT